ncbi:MAG: NEW3 domain-containing protein, partial [Candidatus Aenigmatarchaeota archaeon]
MKKWLVFIFLTLFLLPSVGFAVDCDYDCRHRGGIGECTGWAYSSCSSGYIEGKGSCKGWWVFTPKCCCRPVITVSHSPTQVTNKDKVTYTAKLLVSMPITQLSIIVKSDAGSSMNSCTSSECSLTAGPYKAGTTVIYQAIVNPVMGGSIFTEEKSFTVGATKECDRNKWSECVVDCKNKCGILKGTERNECGEERGCSKDCGSCPSGYECRNNRCEKIGEEAPITTCARSNPSISVNPSSYTATAGTEKEYEVTVKNNNQNCKDSVFILEASCPPGWDCSWSPSSLTISSGSSAKSTLKVRSSAKESPGLFRIKIVVSDKESSVYRASTYVDYMVFSGQQPSLGREEGEALSVTTTIPSCPICSQPSQLPCQCGNSRVDCAYGYCYCSAKGQVHYSIQDCEKASNYLTLSLSPSKSTYAPNEEITVNVEGYAFNQIGGIYIYDVQGSSTSTTYCGEFQAANRPVKCSQKISFPSEASRICVKAKMHVYY